MSSKRIIGTDEAGYGPQLGPLVIGSVAFDVDSEADLDNVFAPLGGGIELGSLGVVKVNDSKQLFAPGKAGGLMMLESAMIAAAVCVSATRISDLAGWLKLLSVDPSQSIGRHRWYERLDQPFPQDVDEPGSWESITESVSPHLMTPKISLVGIAAGVIPVAEFNRLCQRAGNKATLLSEQTVSIAMQRMQDIESGDIEIFSDKHGGRAYYGGLLQHFFPDAQLAIEKEGREESCYRLIDGGRRIRWHFRAKGDRFVPVAYASMIAKYTRERMMGVFNEYWSQRVPGLKPTAGYPGDAKRFINAIESVIQAEGIKTDELVRAR